MKQLSNRRKMLFALFTGILLISSFIVFVLDQKKIKTSDTERTMTEESSSTPTFSSTVQPTITANPSSQPAIPSAQPSTKPTPAGQSIPIMSTNDWKTASLEGVSFKIPANATCNSDNACSEVTYPIVHNGKTLQLPAKITIQVVSYAGGSRRTQYDSMSPSVKECKPIYVESTFGSVSALQIAVDGGWCQGGYVGAIVAVVDQKMVIIGPDLSYGGDSKKISRWIERDTLVSTLQTK